MALGDVLSVRVPAARRSPQRVHRGTRPPARRAAIDAEPRARHRHTTPKEGQST